MAIERFGKDHASNLLYVETRVVDHGGVLLSAHLNSRFNGAPPTRLAGGELAEGHDDRDCLTDMVMAGLMTLEFDDNLKPNEYARAQLTDLGWKVAHLLRRNRGEKRGDANFNWVAEPPGLVPTSRERAKTPQER